MRTILTIALLAGSLIAQQPSRAEVDLQAAIRTETVSGDLNAAIKQYNTVVAKYAKERAVAAQALVRMAECYQKLGDAQSQRIYERVVRDYADQKDAVTIARARLGGENTLTKRLLCTECGDYETTTTLDGRWIAFTDYNNGDVAIRDMATGQVKHLLAKSDSGDPGTYVEEPVLSPDLKQVAYLWQTGPGGLGFPTQLRVMANEPGAKPRVLVAGDAEHPYCEPVGWSPDGKSILVNAGRPEHNLDYAWISVADGSIRTIKSIGRRHQGSGSTDAKVSPDGRYIAYAAHPVDGSADVHIYVLAADGSSETEVVKTAGRNKSPVWAPDGKHLLFLSDRSGNFALWSVPIENGKAAATPSLVHSSFGPDADGIWPIGVTRSGSYEYIQEPNDLEQISIARIDAAGRKIQGRTGAAETFVGVAPAWSPDGKSIAFKRHHPGAGNGDDDLVVHSLETGDERTFPTPLGNTGPGQPVWLHDGKVILTGLVGPRRAPLGIFRVDLASGQWKPVPFATADLSADERIRYFVRAGAVVAFDLTTGTGKEILPADRQDPWASLALSPDGRTLAVWRSDSHARRAYVATLGVDGNGFREVFATSLAGFAERRTQVAWTRDGQTILFDWPQEDKAKISSSTVGWPRRIMRIAAAGGTPEFTGIEAEGLLSMDVSPDGSQIAYSASKPTQELWSLDNVLAKLK